MAITRIERNGTWIEKADDPKGAMELHEKHGSALVKRGREDFHNKFLKDLKEGFEKVKDPGGNETYMRRDRVESALAQGYTLEKSREAGYFQVPDLPFMRGRERKWGRTVYKYDKESGKLVEVT